MSDKESNNTSESEEKSEINSEESKSVEVLTNRFLIQTINI